MPPKQQAPESNSDSILEAILETSNTNAQSQESLLETIAQKTEANGNSAEALAEASLSKQDEILQAVKDKPEVQKIKIVTDESELADNFFRMLRGQKGERGEKGDSITGPQGPQGTQGPKGDKGDKGDSIVGPIGPQGPKGDSIKGDKGDSIVGPMGPMGPKGEPGKDGRDGKDLSEETITKLAKKLKKDSESNLLFVNNGAVKSVIAGENITITGDPQNPIISSTGGGGGGTWGSITGTLSDQTDLQSALDAKQGDITLTTTGTSGAATLIGDTLNIPQYAASITGSDTQVLFFDGANNPAGDAGLTYTKASDTLNILGGINLGGTATTESNLSWSTVQTVDTTVLALGATSRGLVIVENGDTGFDFAHAQQTNPTLFIHSAAQSTTQWAAISHNQTQARLTTGTDVPFQITGPGSTSGALIGNIVGVPNRAFVGAGTGSSYMIVGIGSSGLLFMNNGLNTFRGGVSDGGNWRFASDGTLATAKVEIEATSGGSQKALIVNNSTSTGNIFEAMDNGTAVFTVADGGMLTVAKSANAMQFTANSYINWNGNSDIGNANLLVVAGTGSSWASTDLAVRGASRVFLSSGATAGLMLGSDLGVTIGSSSVTGTAKALTVNNGTSTGNIFEAQDNGTAVLTVADGGNVTTTAQYIAPINTVGYSFVGVPTYGIQYNSGLNGILLVTGGNAYAGATTTNGFEVSVDGVTFKSGTVTAGTADTFLTREAAATLQMGRDVNGAAVNQTFKAHDGITGTDISGANLTLAGGRGTGNAVGGDRVEQTAVPVASGTTAQTLGDRQRVLAKYTTITESTATAFASVTVASGTVAGGTILYTVEANDATDYQSLTGVVAFDIVNKAGTCTIVITDTQNGTGACSSGTLTGTITATDAGSGVVQFKMNAVSSLTQTTLRINAQVKKNFGTGAIAAI